MSLQDSITTYNVLNGDGKSVLKEPKAMDARTAKAAGATSSLQPFPDVARPRDQLTISLKGHPYLHDDGHLEHAAIRSLFLLLSAVQYVVIGGGWYAFPVYLNQILPDYVPLSSSTITLLGGSAFVSMGIVAGLVLWVEQFSWSSKTKLTFWSVLIGAFVLAAWILLTALVVLPSGDFQQTHGIGIVGLCMVLQGFAVGALFCKWYGVVVTLLKQEWRIVGSCFGTAGFAAGAILSLGLKLVMGAKPWMVMMCALQCITVFVFVTVGVAFMDALLIAAPQDLQQSAGGVVQESESALALMWELALWRRQWDSQTLANSSCDVSSGQFYLLLCSFVSMLTLGPTFMANLGPLTSEDEEAGSDHDHTVVILLSVAAQTTGRLIHPIVTIYLDKAVDKMADNLPWSLELRSSLRFDDMKHSMKTTRNTLSFSLLAGLIFTVGLFCLRFMPNVSFVAASTCMSVGYGFVWTAATNYIFVFPAQHFHVILPIFQVIGSAGQLILILCISLMDMGKTEIFTTLLVTAIVAVFFTAAAFFARLQAEPWRSKASNATSLHAPLVQPC